MATAVMSILVIHQTWPEVESMVGTWRTDLLLQLNPLLIVAAIARHLHKQEREREWEGPDANMRMLFNVAWTILLVAILLELRL